MVKKDLKLIWENIKEIGDLNTINLFKKLLEESIDNLRIDNDTAEGVEILKNQGAIVSLLRIIFLITWK